MQTQPGTLVPQAPGAQSWHAGCCLSLHLRTDLEGEGPQPSRLTVQRQKNCQVQCWLPAGREALGKSHFQATS